MAARSVVYWILLAVYVLLQECDFTVQSYCHTNDTNPYRLYASKTSYDIVRATEVKNETLPGCEAIQLYVTTRHGSRYDSTADMENMHKVLPAWRDRIFNNTIGGILCEGDRNLLKGWKPRLNTSRSKQLSETGKQEMYDIAQRFLERYRGLLDVPYDKDLFWFRSSRVSRTINSAKAFARGLFNRTDMDPKDLDKLVNNISMVIPPLATDWVLKFYDNCEKYIKEVDSVEPAERTKFLKGKHYDDLKASISKRFRIPLKMLNITTLDIFYDMCRFEYAIFHDTSPWCVLFTEENLKTVEYGEDLKYYWKQGYGHKINYEMACKLVEDIQTALKTGKETGKPRGVFRFSHTQVMNSLYARLDLFKPDQVLTADNFPSQQNRAWWNSKIGPFSTNLAFALYKCGTEYKIKTFSQEGAIKLPFCNNQELCPFSTFMKTLDPIVKSCDIPKICAPSSSTTLQSSLSCLLAMILCVFACKWTRT